MRLSVLVSSALLAFIISVQARPLVPVVDEERVRTDEHMIKAERLHGRFDFVLDDEDTYSDATTGTSQRDNCAQTPVRLKRSDGVMVTKRIYMCD